MKKYGMRAKDLKEALKNIPDDTEIFIANSMNVCGNISALCEAREDAYGSFGESLPCIILGSAENTRFEVGE